MRRHLVLFSASVVGGFFAAAAAWLVATAPVGSPPPPPKDQSRLVLELKPVAEPASLPNIPVQVVLFRPPAPVVWRQENITATVFARRHERSAYGGGLIDRNLPGCALPFRFEGELPVLRVFRGTRHVDCPVVDIGPWLIDDAYWIDPAARPLVEELRRLRRPAHRGRIPTQDAAIDLTPAAAAAIGLRDRGKVAWEFLKGE